MNSTCCDFASYLFHIAFKSGQRFHNSKLNRQSLERSLLCS